MKKELGLSWFCLLLFSIGVSQCSSQTQNENNDSSAENEASYAQQRAQLVKLLTVEGIVEAKVLAAMNKVPRHLFVPDSWRSRAYEDTALPIGEGQTISQPYVVAFMTEALKLQGHEKVLEIGTGSGYQAAILAELTQEVYTIEIVASLAERASQLLLKLGYQNIKVKSGDGYEGWSEYQPFHAIIVTCAPDHIPQPLQDQLAVGGRMIIPVGPENETQYLVLLEKAETGKLLKREVLPVRFVPMTGKAQEKH